MSAKAAGNGYERHEERQKSKGKGFSFLFFFERGGGAGCFRKRGRPMREREDEFELPDGLVRELRAAYRPAGGMPQEADRRVTAAFGRRWRWWGWRGAAAAAAVGVVIGGGVWWQMEQGAKPVAYARTGDIRDAFYVAREVRAGKQLDAGWDANGDGRVDENDARVLAMMAVRVER
jgi:hypothetical protein